MDWNVTFEDLVFFKEHYLLALMALAFTAYTYATKRLTAFNLSLFFLLALNALHIWMTFEISELWKIPEYLNSAFYLWYISFSLTDFIYAGTCCWLIKSLDLMWDRATLYILVIKTCLGVFHIVMMTSELIAPNTLDHLYSTLIMTANIFMATLIIIMSIRALLVRFNVITITAKE